MSNKNWFISFSLLAVLLAVFPLTQGAAFVAGMVAFAFMIAWAIDCEDI